MSNSTGTGPTVAELDRAFVRMLGRCDAASIEYRRAAARYDRATGDDIGPAFEAQHRAGRASLRRRLALGRIADAMRGAL